MEEKLTKAAVIAALEIASGGDVDLYKKGVQEYKNLVSEGLSEEDAFDAAAKVVADGDEERYQKALEAFSAYFIKVDDFDKSEPEPTVEETPEQSEDSTETEVSEESDEEYSSRIAKKQEKRDRIFNRFLIIVGGIFVVLMLALIATFFWPSGTTTEKPVSNETWQMSASDYGQNRWFSDGIQEIKDAKTDAEAADAAHAWLEKVKLDPALLAGAAQYFLYEKVDPSTLVKDDWATQEAVKLYSRLSIALSMAKITPSEAPANGINSGVSNGQVVAASKPGISGDRKAVKVVLEDGTVVDIMARCGNVVTPIVPDLPTGPTDQEPIPEPTPEPIPPVSHHHHSTPKVEPKDPTEDVLVNEDVADWKVNSDTQPLMTVDTSSNGSSDSNALQETPKSDARDAEQAAEDDADAAVDAADDARDEAIDSGAGVVDSGKGYDPVPDPTKIDPNW